MESRDRTVLGEEETSDVKRDEIQIMNFNCRVLDETFCNKTTYTRHATKTAASQVLTKPKRTRRTGSEGNWRVHNGRSVYAWGLYYTLYDYAIAARGYGSY